jgi:DNA-binding beta-propeller fold protein YncE
VRGNIHVEWSDTSDHVAIPNGSTDEVVDNKLLSGSMNGGLAVDPGLGHVYAGLSGSVHVFDETTGNLTNTAQRRLV